MGTLGGPAEKNRKLQKKYVVSKGTVMLVDVDCRGPLSDVFLRAGSNLPPPPPDPRCFHPSSHISVSSPPFFMWLPRFLT